jgi:hypothetical protein
MVSSLVSMTHLTSYFSDSLTLRRSIRCRDLSWKAQSLASPRRTPCARQEGRRRRPGKAPVCFRWSSCRHRRQRVRGQASIPAGRPGSFVGCKRRPSPRTSVHVSMTCTRKYTPLTAIVPEGPASKKHEAPFHMFHSVITFIYYIFEDTSDAQHCSGASHGTTSHSP